MKNEYLQQAEDFLKSANAKMQIDFVGLAINREWKEKKARPLYNVTITTPRGFYSFDFWDSLHNAEVKAMDYNAYARKRYGRAFDDLSYGEQQTVRRELKAKKVDASLSSYDVLACLTKYNPGTFSNFCFEFGYDEDNRTAERIYFAVQEEYNNLCRIFTEEQMEELTNIQ